MQKSTFLIVATLSVLAANAITGTPPRGSGQDERAKKVDELFSPWNTGVTPGAVVAVIRDGTIIYQHAYGMADLERDSPLSPESVFDIASISKQFVANEHSLAPGTRQAVSFGIRISIATGWAREGRS